MKLKIYLLFIYFFMAVIISTEPIKAQSNVAGTLDSSFGINGFAYFDGANAASYAVAIQEDGKIIQGGRGSYNGVLGLILVRFTINGDIDFSFGNNGIVFLDLPGTTENIAAIGFQTDGKIITAGPIQGTYYEQINIAVIRYMPDGRIDSSFGEDGIAITDIRYTDIVKAMVIQPDDKIIVTGTTLNDHNDTETSFTIRYSKDGVLDNSFGVNGIVLTTYQQPITISSVALQTNGRIVVGGYYSLLGRFVFVRYMSDGNKDLEFGKNGIAVISFSNTQGGDALYDIAIQNDGKIYGAGRKYDDVTSNMTVVRIDSIGKLDLTFGEGTGNVVTDFGEGNSFAQTVLIQSDNKIILVGVSGYDTGYVTLARYQNNGSLDSSFGIYATVTTYAGEFFGTSAALQSDIKIIVGTSVYLPDLDFNEYTLIRYNGDPTLISLAKNIKVSEGSTGYTNAVFHVTLNNTSSLPVKAKYRTVNGTAKAGIDYVADSGVVTIQAGRIMKKITIEVIGDNMQEPNKKFYLQIDEPVNAELGALTYASCTIKNDDALRTGYNNLTLPAIKISPNPVKDVLQLQGLDANSNATISIVNLQGTVIDAAVVSNSSSYTKNIGQLQHGTYYIKIQQKEKVSTVMFMKE